MVQSSQPKIQIWLFYLLLFLQIALVLFLSWKPIHSIMVFALIAFLIFTSVNPGKIYLLLITAVLIIPASNYVVTPFFWGYNLKLLYVIITVIVFLCLLEIMTHRRKFVPTKFCPIMLFYVLWITFTALVGYLNNYSIGKIQDDYLVLMLYGLYFIIPTLVNGKKEFDSILKVFIICTLIIGLEYIIIFIYHIMQGEFVRINPNQGQIFLFSLPLCIGIISGTNISRYKKFFITVVITIALGAVAITLTRGLWIALMISSITMIILFYRKINKKVLFSTVAAVLLGAVLLLIYLRIRTGVDMWTLFVTRLGTFFKVTQVSSVKLRLTQINLVLQQIIQNPVLGHGLGKQIYSSYIGAAARVTWIDNSYLSILWKLGLIGAILFLLLFIFALKASVKIFRETEDDLVKIYSGAFISFTIGFLFLGIMSPLLVKYPLNIIWVSLIALLDVTRYLSDEHINSNR